ncbi:MAG: S8 family serine peptidase [Bdellovibrionota bacterium]
MFRAFLLTLFFVSHASASESVPGEFVVALSKDAKSIPSLESKLGGKILRHVRKDIVLVKRNQKETGQLALEKIRDLGFVKAASPNFIYRTVGIPNDPEFGNLWGLANSGALDSSGVRGISGVDIGAVRAWEITTGSSDVVVAVVDTGIDFRIPELNVNAWINEKERDGVEGVDDDDNGYVDDVNGYDFANEDGNPYDDHGHGTHCAGTVGARGNDSSGVAGVAWNVRLMAVKFMDSRGSGTLANAIRAIDYARINGAKISSNSWGGGGYNDLLRNAIVDAEKTGQLFIAAAGNDGMNNDDDATYPATYDLENIIAVAAVNNRGELAEFSNYGKISVDIAAPGVNVLSTVPNGVQYYSGTSMATPHVSGVAALLISQNPELGYSELKEKILKSARPLKTLEGKISSGGMLDAFYSLTGDTPPQDPNDPEKFNSKREEILSSSHPYGEGLEQVFTITQPGAKRIAAHFSKFETEYSFDYVEFFNGAGESLGKWSGIKDGAFSPIADGDTLTMKLSTDFTVSLYGFDIDEVYFEQE